MQGAARGHLGPAETLGCRRSPGEALRIGSLPARGTGRQCEGCAVPLPPTCSVPSSSRAHGGLSTGHCPSAHPAQLHASPSTLPAHGHCCTPCAHHTEHMGGLGALLRVRCQHSPRLYHQRAAYTHRAEHAAAPHSQHNLAATAHCTALSWLPLHGPAASGMLCVRVPSALQAPCLCKACCTHDQCTVHAALAARGLGAPCRDPPVTLMSPPCVPWPVLLFRAGAWGSPPRGAPADGHRPGSLVQRKQCWVASPGPLSPPQPPLPALNAVPGGTRGRSREKQSCRSRGGGPALRTGTGWHWARWAVPGAEPGPGTDGTAAR